MSHTEIDIFDTAIDLERLHFATGWDEGYRAGLAEGTSDGWHTGFKLGFEVGEEVGFYQGCISVWAAALVVDSQAFPPRAQKSIAQLSKLLGSFPLTEPERESFQDELQHLRGKFRSLLSALGVSLGYPGMPRSGTSDPSDF